MFPARSIDDTNKRLHMGNSTASLP